MVKLGARVRDRVTGFEGIATARAEYLYSSARVLVESEGLQEGKPVEDWFDEARLDEEVVTAVRV